MAIELPSLLACLLANPDFRRRLAVTLAAMVAYRLGSFVPIPIQGFRPEEWSAPGMTAQSVSVFALGITPFFLVLLFLELAKLVFPALKRWEAATPGNATRLQHFVFIAALLLAGFQAIAVVHNLERMATFHGIPCRGYASNPLTMLDSEYTYAAVITLVGGTALVGWMAGYADHISRPRKRLLDLRGIHLSAATTTGCATDDQLPGRFPGMRARRVAVREAAAFSFWRWD